MLADNSMLSSFTRCEWLYGLRYELHRKSLTPRVATDTGTLVHEFFSNHVGGHDTQPALLAALETLQSLDVPNAEISVAIGKYQSACAQLTAHYPRLVSPNGTVLILAPSCPCGIALDFTCPQCGLVETSNALLRSPRWIVRYPEIAFQLPLSERHNYMGRIDVIVEDGNQQLFILELKTSGFANQPTWREYWRLATQPRGYVWAAALHTTKTINGSIILPVLMTTRQEKKVKYGYAKMTPEIKLTYTPQALAQWQSSTIALMDKLENSNLLPTGQYNGGCSSSAFGKCDYFDYCLSNYNEGLLMQATTEVIWNPLAPSA